MLMRQFGVVAVLAGCLLPVVCANAAPPPSPFFSGLGFAPDANYSAANGISANGAVVVGFSEGQFGPIATIWNGGTLVSLGTLGGVPGTSSAAAASGDGLVVVGASTSATSGPNSEAFRWTAATGMIGLGDFDDGIFASGALAASADGSVIVGYGSHDDAEAMRWTQSTGMVGLGYLSGTIADGRVFSFARDVSADGAVIVGDGSSALGNQAFRWTQAGGMVGLGGLPGVPTGSGFLSEALAISADGKVIVGAALNAGGSFEAFRWTQTGGMAGLGQLPNAPVLFSVANDVSSDGLVIVGTANDIDGNNSAVRWVGASGPARISDLLSSAGVNVGNRRLFLASGVSADGTVIAGSSSLTDTGQVEAWWAVLPLPTHGCLTSQQHNNHTQACATGQPVGFLSSSVLGTSLQAMSAVADRALQSSSASLAAALTTGLQAQCNNVGDTLCLLGLSDDMNFGAASTKNVAALYSVDRDLRVGSRLSYRPETDYADAFEGTARETALSVAVFGTWQAQAGFNLYATAVADRLEQDIARGYLNGTDRTRSEGMRDGLSTAMAVGAAWPFDVWGASFTPYARYEASSVSLSKYAEHGGPFAATFDAVDGAQQVVRSGMDGRIRVSDALSLDMDAQWLHRVGGGAPEITGRLAILDSGFKLAGVALHDDWAELHLDLRYRTEAIRFGLSAEASNARDVPEFGARFEFALAF